MEHVKVFDGRALVNGLPRFGAAGFVGAVVHDGDAGMDRIDKRTRVGKVHPVMIDQIEIDVADEVAGANKRNLFCLGQVAEIEKAESAVTDEDAG